MSILPDAIPSHASQIPAKLAEVFVFHDMDGRLPSRVLVHEFPRGPLNRRTGAYGENRLDLDGRNVMAFMVGRDVKWNTAGGVYESDLTEIDGYYRDFSLKEMSGSEAIREELGDSCPSRVYVHYRICDIAEKDQVVRHLVDLAERQLNEEMLVAIRRWGCVQEFISSGAVERPSAPKTVGSQAIADLLEGLVQPDAKGCGQAVAREALAMIASDVAGGGEDPLASIDAAVTTLLQAREVTRLAMLNAQVLKELDEPALARPSADAFSEPTL